MKTDSAPKTHIQRAMILPLLVCIAISLLVTVFVQSYDLLFPVDAKVYDIGLARRPAQKPEGMIIAGLTDAFVGDHHVSQMPRDKLARLLDALVDAKPAVIAIDVWLDSRVEDGTKRGDEKLRAALLRAKMAGVPVVLAQLNTEEENAGGKGTLAHEATLPFFADTAEVGSITFTQDTDKVVRLMPDETATLPSLPYLVAWHSLKDAGTRKKLEALRRSNIKQARPLDFIASPDLQGTPDAALQLHDAQKILNEPYLAPFLAAGKIVFIGAAFQRSTDYFQTPYNNVEAKRLFYGVELLANATFTYREGALGGGMRLSHESDAVRNRVLALAMLATAIVAAAALSGLLQGIMAFLLASGAALALGYYSAVGGAGSWPHFWAPSPMLVGALFAWITGAGWRQLVIGRELKQVRDVFGGYVGSEVLKQLGGRMPEMGGETRQVAVLFCDIQGFSGLAEGLRDDPARLLQLLNDHFAPLVEALQQQGAYVDNYVGDLVMAVFGAPYSQGSFAADVRAAVQSSLDFERIIDERNKARRERGELPIEVGVGVHCGSAVVGNLGSRRKMHYTAIGDTVNIASRVESETRHYPTRLLVTEDVTAQCPEWQWEFMAETVVKGRTAPVKLYRVKED